MAIFVASTLLQPWAMLANGPPCMKAGVCSVVCTRLGLSASRSRTVMAPATPRSRTRKGFPSEVMPNRMFSMRRCRSSSLVARQRMAISSEAGVMSKPVSCTTPSPRSPVTTLRRERSLTSSTRFQYTSRSEKPSLRYW